MSHLISSTVDVVHTKVRLSVVPVLGACGHPEDPGVAQLSAHHGPVLHVPAVVTDRQAAHSDVALGGVGAHGETQGTRGVTRSASHST